MRIRVFIRALLFAFFLVGNLSSAETGLLWDEEPSGPWVEQWEKVATSILPGTLKVFWWNVGMGQPNALIQKRSAAKNPSVKVRSTVDLNIITVARSQISPDVIALGEMGARTLLPSTRSVLLKRYPYSRRFPYNPETALTGPWIELFSKHPILGETSTLLRANPIAPGFRTSASLNRSYNRVTLEVGGEQIHLLPVHLINPWRQHLHTFRNEPRRNRFWSNLEDGAELVFDSENRLAEQATQLRERLNRDLSVTNPPPGRFEKILLLGDFNIPNRVVGVEPAIFSILNQGLDYVNSEGWPTSFPAPQGWSGSSKHRFKIDHAWTSNLPRDSRGWILPLLGSDHYPLYLVIPTR